jgi:hypothetical protein
MSEIEEHISTLHTYRIFYKENTFMVDMLVYEDNEKRDSKYWGKPYRKRVLK